MVLIVTMAPTGQEEEKVGNLEILNSFLKIG